MMMYEYRSLNCTVSPSTNFTFPPHMHQHIELQLCLTGEVGVICNGTERILKPGEIMISFPHDIHAYQYTGEGTGLMVIVHPSLLPMLEPRLRGLRYENFLSPEGDQLTQIGKALLEAYSEEAPQEVIVGYLYVLFGTVLRMLPVTHQENKISQDTFSRVMEHLSEHYMESISLKTLARTAGVDPSHLSRMFKDRLGYGFLQYLHMLRVEDAKNKLRHTKQKITQIQLSSGFSDQKTFNRVFKELTGMTPGEYRRREQ